MNKHQVSFNSGIGYWLRLIVPLVVAVALCMPAALVKFDTHSGLNSAISLLIFGVAIVACAYILGWIAEAAELDLSGGLALGILALVAILPEYVVEIYFSWSAGTDPTMASYATANLTGANRMVQGFGWPVVAILAFFSMKAIKSRKVARGEKFGIKLEEDSRTDLGFIFYASLILLMVPIMGSMHLMIGIVLILIFGIYIWRISGAPREEPELEGTAAHVGALPKVARRIFMLAFLFFAATVIFLSAHPFADSLITVGNDWGLDEYVMVQWVAPLASEAPEFTLAFLFALRGKQSAALAILISSKLNQWTLLAGSMPVAYVIGGGAGAALPVEGRMAEELWLTLAQTLLGIALLLTLRWTLSSSLLILGLFALTVIPDPTYRTVLGIIHFVLALFYCYIHRAQIKKTLRAPFKKPKV